MTGMLWFDNDPQRKLTEKIDRAARYYQQKYGSKPTLCFVHPGLPATIYEASTDLDIQFNTTVPLDHIWIGSTDA